LRKIAFKTKAALKPPVDATPSGSGIALRVVSAPLRRRRDLS
jgi:hypothetical protein